MAGPVVNPYSGVSWGGVTHRPGVTHMHGAGAGSLSTSYGHGVRAMAWSNYYPEQPTDPASFGTAPADVVFMDNSEQHGCNDTYLHYCPVGSAQSHNGGTKMPWRDAFDEALAALTLPNGGGITINHPVWTYLNDASVIQFLDHDPRVLGIEIYNHMVVSNPAYTSGQRQSAVPLWDRILGTGRRCWGFMAHDHYIETYAPYLGFNMLLMPTLTATDALTAYRDGRFYTTMQPPGSNLVLTSFAVADHQVTLSVTDAETLTMVAGSTTEQVAASSHTFTVPAGATYARFEAGGLNDTLHTNPIMYRLTTPAPSGAATRRNRAFILS